MESKQRDDGSKWTGLSNHKIKCFTGGEIERMTSNYKNVIGRGSFGEVYRGVLEDNSVVAVKKLVRNVREDFDKELSVHREINHRNVVRLIGYCVEENSLMMVTEYIPNGNLSSILHGDNSTPISLEARLRMATECAEALAYMHSYMYTQVIHGDIKPANILIDASLKAKISDFGISRLVKDPDKTLFTEHVMGSIGYMDPLFAKYGRLTAKSDVYSFGVVLVELITRKRVITSDGEANIVDVFSNALANGIRGVRKIIDAEIASKNNTKILERVAKLAFECLRMERDTRPDMVNVAERLRALLARASHLGYQRAGLFSWARKSKPTPPALVKATSPLTPPAVVTDTSPLTPPALVTPPAPTAGVHEPSTRPLHLYTIIKVARDEDLKQQIGKDIYFDLVDHEKVRNFRIQKQLPFSSFKEEVAKEYGIPVQSLRFWLWAKRHNHTYRPNRPLTPHDETQSVGQVGELSNNAHNAELKLFLEVELGLDLRPLPPPAKGKEDILLFFKLYNPEKEELCFMGRFFVKALGKASEILAKLNEMAGFSPDQEIELYEEIKFEPNVMCEIIDKNRTFRSSQLQDGDIICFQKLPRAYDDTQVRYPFVPLFLEYAHNRQVVHFRSLEKPKDDDFSLELSKLHTYDDVVERVARRLGLEDPAKIRLTSHNCYSEQPKPQPVKYRGVEHLLDMLIHYDQTSDILYYEVLDIPLPELQFLKTLKVAFHHPTKDEVVIHSIRLPKNSTIADVINDLKTKVELSSPNAELRVLDVFYHKIYKIFPLLEKIENIKYRYWTLRAEEIPEEEKNMGPNDRLIHVYHFMKDVNQTQQIQNFGDPFFLLVREGETLAEIKKRIQSKLQISAEEFSKWKFAFISMNRPDYLQDSDVITSRFQREVYGAWEQYLGMEHTDTAPKRAYTVNHNRHSYEKPVRIYN